MKRISFILLLLIVVHFDSLAQSEKVKVYLARPAGPDRYVPYFTYMDQQLMCKLGSGKYSVHEVEPGEHKFHAQYKGKMDTNPTDVLVVNMEPGKTYYLSVNIETKAFAKGRFYLEQLNEETGKKWVEAFKFDKECL